VASIFRRQRLVSFLIYKSSSHDSSLEGDGFELLVTPRRNSPRARHVVSAHGSTSLERH